MGEILSTEEAVACSDDRYPDDGTLVTASVLRLLRSHEALRARLAEVEQALRELVDACKTNPNADMWQELVVRVAEAVLDKGELEPCA